MQFGEDARGGLDWRAYEDRYDEEENHTGGLCVAPFATRCPISLNDVALLPVLTVARLIAREYPQTNNAQRDLKTQGSRSIALSRSDQPGVVVPPTM